jgi:hydroxymethylpyrimidine/phosphomethylpyrimidine kinase
VSAHPAVVSVHALDAGGGDGIVADAAVFSELDCRALCVVTSVVPPDPLPAGLLAGQFESIKRLAPVAAMRTGFLKGTAQVELVAGFLRKTAPETAVVSWPPLDAETEEAMREHVLPAARVVVARASELAPAVGRDIEDLDDLRDAAASLRKLGARAVIVAGLIARGRVFDLLDDEGAVALLDTARVQAMRVTGLAGAHAAALAAHLARGLTLTQAAEAAQRYVGFRLRRGR